MGLAGYYRKFIRNYGIICRALTALLKKGVVFCWTHTEEQAFQALKQALMSAPVLALPDFTKTFVVETYACDVGMGAVLMQEGHPLAYVSKSLGPKNHALSVYEKEYLAILLAVEHWRQYLQMSEFVILTDQCSLTNLADQRLHTCWQQKALTKLLGLQYTIKYEKGTDNSAADALSRRPHDTAELQTTSTVQPEWLSDIVSSYENDPYSQKLIQKLAFAPSSDSKFTLRNGLLYSQGCIWVGTDTALQTRIVKAFHDTPLGGHSGYPVTYRRIK